MKRVALFGVFLVAAYGTAAHSASGAFDGAWAPQYGNCSPNRSVTFGTTKWQVKDNAFTLTWSTSRVLHKCTSQIGPDGAFDNQKCDLPMSGKFAGDQVQFKFQSPDSFCNITATRAK